MADQRELAQSLQSELQRLALASLSKEQLTKFGFEVLRLAPRLRTATMVEVLRLMTSENRFFFEVMQRHGEQTCLEMLRFIYLE